MRTACPNHFTASFRTVWIRMFSWNLFFTLLVICDAFKKDSRIKAACKIGWTSSKQSIGHMQKEHFSNTCLFWWLNINSDSLYQELRSSPQPFCKHRPSVMHCLCLRRVCLCVFWCQNMCVVVFCSLRNLNGVRLFCNTLTWLMTDPTADQADLATDSLKGRRSRRQRLRERLSSGLSATASGLSATWSRAASEFRRPRTSSGEGEPGDRPEPDRAENVELAPRDSREDPEKKWQKMWESIACEGNDAMSLACERWRRSLAGERNTFWSKLTLKVNDSIHSTDSPRKDWDRVSKAVRAGVPENLRCAVWTACSGAMTKKKEALTVLSLDQSDALEFSYHFFVKQGLTLKNEASGVIEVDVPRTGCEEALFEPVRRVLLAFAAKNPELGYCQSMNFIAAALLRYCDEESAFWILCSLLEDILPEGYYTRNMVGIRVDMLVLNSLVMRYLPNLHKHLSEHNVDLSPVSMNWFLCLYVNTLPENARDRVLDCLLHEGSKVPKSVESTQSTWFSPSYLVYDVLCTFVVLVLFGEALLLCLKREYL